MGTGKARVLALAVGEMLPELDPYERKKWISLARNYGVRFTVVPGGLKRIR